MLNLNKTGTDTNIDLISCVLDMSKDTLMEPFISAEETLAKAKEVTTQENVLITEESQEVLMKDSSQEASDDLEVDIL